MLALTYKKYKKKLPLSYGTGVRLFTHPATFPKTVAFGSLLEFLRPTYSYFIGLSILCLEHMVM